MTKTRNIGIPTDCDPSRFAAFAVTVDVVVLYADPGRDPSARGEDVTRVSSVVQDGQGGDGPKTCNLVLTVA
jgi:hypothetical protein